MKIFRRLAAVVLVGLSSPALAASVTQQNVQIPTSGTLQAFQFLTDGTHDWPLLDIYDGTTFGTFNSGDGGLLVHIAGGTAAVTGTFWQTTQPVSAASLPLPTGAATAANQTNTQGVIGNATSPLDMSVAGAVYNSSPLTLTNGQSAALQADANGYLNVHVQAGGGSGGTSSSFSATFPSTGTAAGAEYLSSPPSLTSGQMVALQTTSAGSLHTTVDNTNANGSATSANSSPVVIASDQAAVATKAASGAFVAGSIADLAHGQGTMAASVPVVIASNQSGVPVTGTFWQTTQPVSAASLPLPSGAATSALQTTINTTLGSPMQNSGGTVTVTQATAANLNMTCANCSGSGASGTDGTGFTAGSSVFAPGGGVYQASATSNPLTAGDWGVWQLTHYRAGMVDWYNSSGTEMGTSGSPVQVSLANTGANGTAVLVTGTGGTFPITASSLPLPTGAATSALQTTINATLGSPFQAGGSIGNTAFGISGTLPAFASTPTVALNTTPSLANGNGVVPTQGGAVLGVTNGGYQNILQGNAVLSVTNPAYVQAVANSVGGAGQTGNIVPNNTTAVVVKASAGTLYSVQLAGLGSAPAYLKIYNATSATCGSGTPVARYMIPAASTAANGAGNNINLGPVGVAYSTGITYCVTTGIADTDTTAPAASTFLVNLVWK